MEENGACYGNLRPECIFVNDHDVIIVNLDTELLSEEKLRKRLIKGNKVDAYNWGIILYSLLNKASASKLKNAMNKRLSCKEHEDAVKRLEANNIFMRMLINILLRVLDKEVENRPGFKELIELMKPIEVYYKKEFSSLKKIILTMNEEAGILTVNYRRAET
jgi:hypothetical protein